MEVRFLLICEGSSDASLITHIERLLVECGAAEASGAASYFGAKVREKIRIGLSNYGEADLLFVHRDANNAGAAARYSEISSEVDHAGYPEKWIGIVPIRAMEAWLLVDEDSIRRVAGRPGGTENLDLPSPRRVENVNDPKEALKQALVRAAAPKGARRKRNLEKEFGALRRQLAENLPIGGALEQVPAWARFRDDVATALSSMATSRRD